MSIRQPSRPARIELALPCTTPPGQAVAAQSPPGTGQDAPRTNGARPMGGGGHRGGGGRC